MDSESAYQAGIGALTDLWERPEDEPDQLPNEIRSKIAIVIDAEAQVSQRYALLTQLLLKHIMDVPDSRALRDLGDDYFTARSFAKYTTAKFPAIARRLGNSTDPYVSNPLRSQSLEDSLKSGRGGSKWEALLDVLDAVDAKGELTEPALKHTVALIRGLDEEAPATKTTPAAPDVQTDLTSLHQHTGLVDDLLLDMLEVLESDQPQIILAGPPGTSKTHTAQALAGYLTGGDTARVTTVQLHATYGYEDFVEGLRPATSDAGVLTFKVEPGVLRRVAAACNPAGTAPDERPRVLIMDEMNRANLPRVLGELLFAIERRGEPVDLLHTPGFALPPQILLIGTMNTADRSIRSIDAAVRRRFMIFELAPSGEALEAFYQDHDNEVPELVVGFNELNDQLTQLLDRHHTIGHTFLMDERGMTSGRLNQVWLRQIRPLIEEYLFDLPDELARFTVDAFWPSAVT
ncbi:McrB family protein [Terrabacter sp. 2TAF16]|uniref:McrB family protein n=1 Tax=Terrabacter sp. 2TAF16 TaxID=3233008 RepID=UPI003F9B1053